MMTEEPTTLVERKLVTEETVVYANVKSIGLGGTPTLLRKMCTGIRACLQVLYMILKE